MSFHSLYTGRRACLAIALLFVLSLPAVTPRIYASDEIEYFSFLRSLWFDGDVSFENEYRYFYDRGIARSPAFHETFLDRVSETGLRVNFGTIGCAILWAPFYGAADLWVRVQRWAGSDVEANGLSAPYIAAACYGSAFYALIALLLARAAANRLLGRPEGWFEDLLPVLAVWFGTPLFFYMYIAPPMSHAASAFAVAAFVFAWLHVRERWSARGLALLGALAALMTMVREQDAFVAIGPAVDYAVTLVRGRGVNRSRLLMGAVLGSAAFVLAFLPQALAYLALNGRIGPSHMVSRKMSWSAPHASQVLFSPEHGFFAWTPLALVAVSAVAWLALAGGHETGAATRRRVGGCLLLIVALQVWVAGSVESWTVAGAFGQRRFVALTIVLVIGVAVLARAATRAAATRTALLVGLVLATWWNLGLVVQFGTGMMDRQRLELARNARTSFVELPVRLPELAWRYLFDRQSFYRPPQAAPPGVSR